MIQKTNVMVKILISGIFQARGVRPLLCKIRLKNHHSALKKEVGLLVDYNKYTVYQTINYNINCLLDRINIITAITPKL